MSKSKIYTELHNKNLELFFQSSEVQAYTNFCRKSEYLSKNGTLDGFDVDGFEVVDRAKESGFPYWVRMNLVDSFINTLCNTYLSSFPNIEFKERKLVSMLAIIDKKEEAKFIAEQIGALSTGLPSEGKTLAQKLLESDDQLTEFEKSVLESSIKNTPDLSLTLKRHIIDQELHKNKYHDLSLFKNALKSVSVKFIENEIVENDRYNLMFKQCIREALIKGIGIMKNSFFSDSDFINGINNLNSSSSFYFNVVDVDRLAWDFYSSKCNPRNMKWVAEYRLIQADAFYKKIQSAKKSELNEITTNQSNIDSMIHGGDVFVSDYVSIIEYYDLENKVRAYYFDQHVSAEDYTTFTPDYSNATFLWAEEYLGENPYSFLIFSNSFKYFPEGVPTKLLDLQEIINKKLTRLNVDLEKTQSQFISSDLNMDTDQRTDEGHGNKAYQVVSPSSAGAEQMPLSHHFHKETSHDYNPSLYSINAEVHEMALIVGISDSLLGAERRYVSKGETDVMQDALTRKIIDSNKPILGLFENVYNRTLRFILDKRNVPAVCKSIGEDFKILYDKVFFERLDYLEYIKIKCVDLNHDKPTEETLNLLQTIQRWTEMLVQTGTIAPNVLGKHVVKMLGLERVLNQEIVDDFAELEFNLKTQQEMMQRQQQQQQGGEGAPQDGVEKVTKDPKIQG